MDDPAEPTAETTSQQTVEPAPGQVPEHPEGTEHNRENTAQGVEDTADRAESAQKPEDALTATERAIIALEKRRFRYQGSKEQAITHDLGIPVIAYYQQLNVMMDSPRVIAAEPELMNRLRARRDALT